MKVIIDEREASLYDICLSHENYEKESFTLEKRVLQLGDILVTNDDESVTYLTCWVCTCSPPSSYTAGSAPGSPPL